MSGERRGQVALETLVGVSIILILLIFVLFYTVVNNTASETIDENYKNENRCIKIDSIIRSIEANQGGNEVFVDMDADMTITGGVVYIGQKLCFFRGNVANASLTIGKTRIYDVNGVIYFENV